MFPNIGKVASPSITFLPYPSNWKMLQYFYFGSLHVNSSFKNILYFNPLDYNLYKIEKNKISPVLHFSSERTNKNAFLDISKFKKENEVYQFFTENKLFIYNVSETASHVLMTCGVNKLFIKIAYDKTSKKSNKRFS